MGNIKEIKIKNRTYYFFDDMINITNFDANLLKIDKKMHKNIDTYYIGIKDSENVKINSVNPLYLIKKKVRNKYLILDSTDKNEEVLKKYAELCDGIKISLKK